MLRAFALIVIMGLLTIGGQWPAAAAEPVKINFGIQPGTTASWVLRETGVLEKKYGYQVEWVEATHAGAQLEAMAAGAIDLGTMGVPPAVNARNNGAKIVAIADTSANMVHGVVRIGSGIKTPADIKGRKIAYPGKGSWQYGMLQLLLQRSGLKETDVELVRVSLADMPLILEKGDADVFLGQEPQVSHMLLSKKATLFISSRELMIARENAVLSGQLIATESFLAKHPDAAINVIKEMAEANRWIGKNTGDAARLFSKAFGGRVPAEVFKYSFDNSITHFYQDVRSVPAEVKTFIEKTNGIGITKIKDIDAFLKGYLRPELAQKAHGG